MPPSNTLRFAAVLLGLFSLHARASGPATQPATSVGAEIAQPSPDDDKNPAPPVDPPVPAPDDNRPHRPDGPIRGHLLQRLMQPPSAKDISEAMVYMKEHSPNRYNALNDLPDGERKKNLQELTARNYINWMRQMNEDPQLYGVILKRIGAEDTVFGLVNELRKDPPEKKDATNAQLRDEVSALVDIGIQERRLRLDRLEKTVQEQQQKLDEDSAHRDALVSERLKTILSEGLVPGSGGGSRNHNGAHSVDGHTTSP